MSLIKKINYILTVVLAILGTTVFFFDFNEQYNEKLSNLNIDNYSKGESVNVILNINPRESGSSIDEFLEVTYDLFNELEYPGFVFGSEKSKDGVHNIITFFTTRDIKLLSHIETKSKEPINDIINNLNWKITNNPKNDRDIVIDYLDDSYYDFDTGFKSELSIKPITNLLSDYPRESGQIIVTFAVEDSQVESLKRRMIDVYKAFEVETPIEYLIVTNDINTYEIYQRSQSLLSKVFIMPYSILWLSILCVFFISIFVSIQKAKEITINYMHGYSRNRILGKFFIPYIGISSFLFVLTMLLTTLMLTNSYGQLYFDFLVFILPFVGLYLVLMVLSVLLTYLWVLYRFSAEILKENKQYGVIFNIVSLLRIGVIIVLVVPIMSEWLEIVNRHPYIVFYDNNTHLKEGITISFSSLNASIEDDQIKVSNHFKEAVSNQQLGYADFMEYLMLSMHKQLDIHDEYYLTSNQITLPKIPYLIVNQRYIQDYKDIEIYNTEKVTALIPVEFKGKKEHEILKSQSEVAVQFYSGNYVFAPHFETGPEIPMSGVLNNPIILVDPDPLLFQFEGKIVDFSRRGELLSFANELEEKYPTTFQFATIESSFQRNLINQQRSISIFIQLVLIYMILISVFLFTSLSVYFTSFGKEMAVRYMNGYGYFRRYINLFRVSILVSSISFSTTYYLLNHNVKMHLPFFITLIFATLLLETVLTTIVIRFFERKNIPIIIKGDI